MTHGTLRSLLAGTGLVVTMSLPAFADADLARRAPVYVSKEYGVGYFYQRQRAISRPRYVETAQPVKVVEQGPVYDTVPGPRLVARQIAPAHPTPVVVANQGYAYGAPAVVVAQPDPAARFCQVDGRVRGAVLCSPYSYHPYGAYGYRPFGTYGEPARSSYPSDGQSYASGHSGPRVIQVEPAR